MEADGPVVTHGHGRLDGGHAARPIGRAQRLDSPRASAGWEAGISAPQSLRQDAEQGRGHERHVPRDDNDRGGGLEHGGEDPANRPETGTDITDQSEVRPPGRSIRRVGHEERWASEGLLTGRHQPVEDSLPSDLDQPLGPAAVAGGGTAGEDRGPGQ
jgi:hypothetical protein